MSELLVSEISVEGAGLDGGDGTVEVYATETTNSDGTTSVTFRIVTGDDWNPDYNLDLNGLFLDYQDDGSTKLTVDGEKSNNLNGTTWDGEKIEWDLAESTGSSTGGADGETSLMEFSLTVDGISLADVDGGLVGLRATSTGEDLEGSLKLVGEIIVPDEPPGDDSYPDMEKDISHVILVFDTVDGDSSGDGYYTVKIDEWNGSNDLDTELDAIMAYLIANDDNVDSSTVLLGAQLKGGNVGTADGSYDDYWADDGSADTTIVDWTAPNGNEVTEVASSDEEPVGMDSLAQDNQTAVDETYDYDVVVA